MFSKKSKKDTPALNYRTEKIMLAAAARESHRSPSARQLLSPERSPPEERQVVEESVAESIVGGGGGHDGGHDGGAGGAGGAGMAASEADVGNIDSLVRASLSEERKSSSGARNKPAARGRSAARSSGRVRPSNSKGAAEGGVVPKSSAPATKEGGGEEQAGDELSIVSTGSLAKTPSSKRLSTERSKQLYNIHQRTQVSRAERMMGSVVSIRNLSYTNNTARRSLKKV